MPIYEFACPDCRRIFNFLSKTVAPDKVPACPKCGGRKMTKQISRFAPIRGGPKAGSTGADAGDDPMAGVDEAKLMQAMAGMENEMAHMDENNPKHLAHMMRRMKEVLPPEAMPKEVETAIRRLEAGEDIEKIEEDMGEIFGDEMGAGPGGSGGYQQDAGLYDM